MKKIGWIILFLIVLFAGDRLIAWFFQHEVKESQFRYSRMYRGEAGADILIVGNSRGLVFYQPYMEKVTGLKTFSLCYYSMPCEIATALTEDYLDRYPNVKTVLVEVSVVEMSDDNLLPGFTTYMSYSPRIDSVLKEKTASVWRTSQFSHLFRFNNEVFQRAMFYKNRLDDDWYFDHTISEQLKEEVKNYSVEFITPEKHVQDLRRLTDFCKARNVNVKLVIGSFYPGYTVHRLDEFRKRIEEATGLHVYDYSQSLHDGSAFCDYLHLNLKGGEEIVDLMLRDGLLPVEATAGPDKKK